MKLLHGWIACFLVCLTLAASHAGASRMESIAAVVNNDAVTMSELNARMHLIMASSGLPDNAEVRAQITPQIINSLIEERIKIQEAARLEFEVAQEDIERAFASIAAQNEFAPDQFRSVLRSEGIPFSTLESQIRAEIAWSMVVQEYLYQNVMVSDNEVDSMQERMRANKGKSEYLVAEIFLPVESPSDESEIKQLADRLTRQLSQGQAPFSRIAAQFSQSASASRSGDLGWVQEGQLPDSLDNALANMNVGEISRAVRSLTGFHILLLRDKRTITEDTIPAADDIMQMIGFERLDRLQQRHLRDLKASAFIERRL